MAHESLAKIVELAGGGNRAALNAAQNLIASMPSTGVVQDQIDRLLQSLPAVSHIDAALRAIDIAADSFRSRIPATVLSAINTR